MFSQHYCPKRSREPSCPTTTASRLLAGLFVLLLLIGALGGCGGAQRDGAGESGASARVAGEDPRVVGTAAGFVEDLWMSEEVASLELVAALEHKPSGVVQVGERLFVAIPRWNGAEATLFELVGASLVPWPNQQANDLENPEGLRSVNGLRRDGRGRVWALDNGRVQLQPAEPGTPKVVVFDGVTGRELFRHVFPEEVAPAATSFLNDLAIDAGRGFAYVLETGMGGPGALLTFEIAADRSRRLLEGHVSVVPDPEEEMIIGGEVATIRVGGEDRVWRVGANPIGLSPDGRMLYWGPMTSRVLFQAPTALLRDSEATAEEIAAAPTPVATKPISDGMDVAPDGRLFVTDVENDGIALVAEGEAPRLLLRAPAFRFPVVVDFVEERSFLFSSNQLHLHALLHGGEGRSEAPFFIWRVTLREGGVADAP